MADSLLEKATSVLSEVKEVASAQADKADAVKDAVDNVVTRGIDGAKSLLHDLEERKSEVSHKILEAVSHFTGSPDSVSADNHNQPLLATGDHEAETTTPWWKSCCGILELLKAMIKPTS